MSRRGLLLCRRPKKMSKMQQKDGYTELLVLEDKTEIWDLPTNNLKHVVHGHQVGFAMPHENSIFKEWGIWEISHFHFRLLIYFLKHMKNCYVQYQFHSKVHSLLGVSYISTKNMVLLLSSIGLAEMAEWIHSKFNKVLEYMVLIWDLHKSTDFTW